MPTSMKDRKFTFKCDGVPPDTFGVVSLKGREALSTPYRFDLTLVSDNTAIDLPSVAGARGVLTLVGEEGSNGYGGVVFSVEQLNEIDGLAYYKAVLVPKLQLLAHVRHNRVFLSKTIPDILKEVLEGNQFTGVDYDFRLKNTYPQREYVCQYGESDLGFFSHRLERDGLYYFFEQAGDAEKLVVTDSSLVHQKFAQGVFSYAPPSGMGEFERERAFSAFAGRQTMMPAKVTLKDYNYRSPSLELMAEAAVSPKGSGDVYVYGEHYSTQDEGDALAAVRAEEFLCRERVFSGQSESPLLRSGFSYTLDSHFRDDFNADYLAVEIDHRGKQTAFISSGTGKALRQEDEYSEYSNESVSIPLQVQFRPERKTVKSRFSGTMNAVVDAEGSGQYAELDDQGRYKIRLPFDLSGAPGGKASAWVRKAEPYAGDGYGMHFPLHKGAEVILSFIDGDPDRPIIAAAVPNPAMASPVVGQNETTAVVQTGGQNRLEFEDSDGDQRVLLQSPNANTWVQLGSARKTGGSGDAEDHTGGDPGADKSGFRVHTEDNYVSCIGSNYSQQISGNKIEVLVGAEEGVVVGASTDFVLGAEMGVTLGMKTEIVGGVIVEMQKGWKWEYNTCTVTTMSPRAEIVAANSIELKAGGVLPSPTPIMAAALAAGGALTSASMSAGNTDKVGEIIEGVLAGAGGVALTTFLVQSSKQLQATAFDSEISLNSNQIEIKSATLDVKNNTKTELTLDDSQSAAAKAYAQANANYLAAKTLYDQQMAQVPPINPVPTAPVAPQQPAPGVLELKTLGTAKIEFDSVSTLEIKAATSAAIAVPNTPNPATEASFTSQQAEIKSPKVEIKATTGAVAIEGTTGVEVQGKDVEISDTGKDTIELKSGEGITIKDTMGSSIEFRAGTIKIKGINNVNIG